MVSADKKNQTKWGYVVEKGIQREERARQRGRESVNAMWKCSKTCVWKLIQLFVQAANDLCTALPFKNMFYHRTLSQQQQVVWKNERTSEKNTSKTPERGESEEKNLREPQTKVKQGKILRRKKAKGS